MKRCNECEELLPLTLFNKDKTSRDGLQFKCRKCKKILNDEWKIRNNEKKLLYMKSLGMTEGYGVYIIIHIPTQKYYIGQGRIFDRKQNHFNLLKRGCNTYGNIQEHYDKDSCISDWEFRVIKKWDFANKEEGIKLEKKYIEEGFSKNPKYILN